MSGRSKNELRLRRMIEKARLLAKQCGVVDEGQELREIKAENYTEFQKSRLELNSLMKQCRDGIKERREMESSGEKGPQMAKMGAEIRGLIKSIKAERGQLQAILEKDRDKVKHGKKDAITPDQLEHNDSVAKLIDSHIAELEKREKEKHRPQLTANTVASNTRAIKRTSADTNDDQIDDPLTLAKMEQIKRNDQAQDDILDQIGEGVAGLDALARDMQKELQVQGVIMDDIGVAMDKAEEKVKNVNRTMKDTLEKAGGASKFLIDAILFVLFLGVVGYIVKIVYDSSK